MTLLILPRGAPAAKCTGSGAHLHITSARNATGHVITTVNLLRETVLPARAATVALNVRPITTRCQLTRTDGLEITLHTPPPPAGPGYEEIPGIGYYRLHEELRTWEEAKATCENEDAFLLILHSQAEAAAIRQLIKRHPKVTNTWIFIGFHDRDKEGHYVTIFGDELTSTGFALWNPSQPDNAGNNEHCGTLHWETVGLNDYPCSKKIPFICEQMVI